MRKILVVGVALFVSGCAHLFEDPNEPDPVVKIMATITQCGIEDPGIFPVQSPAAGFSPELREQLSETTLPPGRDAVVVALGEQPTPGYSLGMLRARRFGDATLNVSMLAEKPSDEMVAAQVITHPCVILDVPEGGWSQIRVEADYPGFPVAWVRRDT